MAIPINLQKQVVGALRKYAGGIFSVPTEAAMPQGLFSGNPHKPCRTADGRPYKCVRPFGVYKTKPRSGFRTYYLFPPAFSLKSDLLQSDKSDFNPIPLFLFYYTPRPGRNTM
ncbi:MAG: hypothetical protein IJ766_07820 [Clostridia bacterium]|nr:hypothetical protein [Clostridia bacterium]